MRTVYSKVVPKYFLSAASNPSYITPRFVWAWAWAQQLSSGLRKKTVQGCCARFSEGEVVLIERQNSLYKQHSSKIIKDMLRILRVTQ